MIVIRSDKEDKGEDKPGGSVLSLLP